MTAAEFIAKWSDATLRERQGSQEHFLDLCRLLGQPTPAEDDPHGERYCFERGATKAGGGDGWADVWRRGCFGWEYKGPHKDLNAAYRQLTIYASNLESPPYLVVDRRMGRGAGGDRGSRRGDARGGCRAERTLSPTG